MDESLRVCKSNHVTLRVSKIVIISDATETFLPVSRCYAGTFWFRQSITGCVNLPVEEETEVRLMCPSGAK